MCDPDSTGAFTIRLSCLARILCAGCLSTAAIAQGPTSGPPEKIVGDAAANEIKVLQANTPYVRYRIHTVDNKGDRVRDILESKDGPVARLILKDNRPLTPQEDADEHTRLQDMLDDPSAFAKHIKSDGTGKKYGIDLIRLMPEAMVYTYVAGQPQRPGMPLEIVLDYEPKSGWKPPTMASEGLTGLKGRMWIDARTRFLTRMEGHIFQPISIGLGVFVKVYPGGELTFDQTEVTPGRWLFTHFTERITARAMLVKTYKENIEIQGGQHKLVEPMSYQDAIHILLSTPLPTS